MCGILGVLGGTPCDDGRFASALRTMSHRGPDDEGDATLGPVRLGFRRLAILDLSERGHQPMVSEDGAVAVVFNGEIYNFKELRSALSRQYRFVSDTDTEVLLHGYRAWGFDRLLGEIDGMFAFAVWDRHGDVLFMARDRPGMKPLFYAHQGEQFSFASTINALRAITQADRLDPRAIDAYLTFQAVPAPMTAFAGVQSLPPAHALEFRPGWSEPRIWRYWDLDYVPKYRMREKDLIERLDDLLHAAVRKRLQSDVGLGTFLSGGIDSGLVSAILAQESGSPVASVTAGFKDPSVDERAVARRVAMRWGLTHHEYVVEPDAVRDLPEILWHHGQPHADVSIVPTYYVAMAAKKRMTVALNGDGGDELFGGYAAPMVARAAARYRRLVPAPLRPGLARAGRSWLESSGFRRRMAMLVTAGAADAESAYRYERGFGGLRSQYGPFLREAYGSWDPHSLYREVWREGRASDDVDRVLYGDFRRYLPDQLLTKMDTATMAHSLEARSPFLDRELTEFAARLPSELRLRHFKTKYLLKQLARRYLPADQIFRKKSGFVMPAGLWMRGRLRPFVETALTSRQFRERELVVPELVGSLMAAHERGDSRASNLVWTLFVFEVWARLHLDRTLNRGESLDVLLG